jgi:RND family efflux transporter MFP subunit
VLALAAGRLTRSTGVAAVLAVSLLPACSRDVEQQTASEPVGVVVGVAAASVQTIRDTVTVAGQVVPAANTDWRIFAPEPALVAELPKGIGDPVAAGELLVRFDVGSISQNFDLRQATLSDADARVATARAELSRLMPLFEQGIIPRNDLEMARAELATAEAAYKTAEAYLEEARLLRNAMRITARFSGIVAEVWHGPGEIVSAEDPEPVMRVIDPSRLEIQIELPTSQAIRVRESHPATVLTFAAGSFTALVTRRPVALLIEAATTPVRLTAPELSMLTLNDVVQVELVLEERPDVVVIPAEAVVVDGQGTFVMTAGSDGTARRREVRIGLTSGGFAEVLEGLESGELVIVEGLAEVTDGATVIVSR